MLIDFNIYKYNFYSGQRDNKKFIMLIEFVTVVLTGCIVYALNHYFSGKQFTGARPNLKGKVAVITGGNTGIGKQTALDLAKQGCQVIIGARDRAKSKKAVEQIKERSGFSRIDELYLDLSDKESIEQFSKNIKSDRIDFLINNAGIMGSSKKTLTKESFQIHYAVNHLGHFYLTYLLYDKLKLSPFFKIINISSIGHKREIGIFPVAKLNLDDINFEKTQFRSSKAYSYSKMYNILFTMALAERIPSDKGACYSLHPGVVRTQVIRYMFPPPLSYLVTLVYPIYYIFSKSAMEGAQTTLHLLYTPAEKLKNGGYYSDCQLSTMNTQMTKENSDRLWQISEKDLKIDFDL